MKTSVITLIALLFMISSSAFAKGKGSKEATKNAKETTLPAEKAITANSNLIVINLNESQDDNGLPQDILDQFGDVLTYPKNVENAAEKECVLVGFTYDDDGYINVESTRSSNEEFIPHVVSNIEKIRLRDGSVTIGKQYFAKFSFKKL